MKIANNENFVSMLSEEKPVMCLFYNKDELTQAKKIKDILIKIKKEYTLLPLYECIVDENEDIQSLCDTVEIPQTPVIVCYKDGNFSRYKNKQFTEPALLLFVGSKKQYIEKPKAKEELVESSED